MITDGKYRDLKSTSDNIWDKNIQIMTLWLVAVVFVWFIERMIASELTHFRVSVGIFDAPLASVVNLLVVLWSGLSGCLAEWQLFSTHFYLKKKKGTDKKTVSFLVGYDHLSPPDTSHTSLVSWGKGNCSYVCNESTTSHKHTLFIPFTTFLSVALMC